MELESIPFESKLVSDIEPAPWHGFGFLDKLLAVALPVLAIGTFALPFLNLSILRRLSGIPVLGGALDWLVNQNGSWIAGTALILLWITFLFFRRWRIISNEHQWVDAGCPQCQELELVRVSRERSDRWYGLLRIPAFRYACRNCTWRGLRIAHRHRYRVLAHEEVITASSLTVEPAGTQNRYEEANAVETVQYAQDSLMADEHLEPVEIVSGGPMTSDATTEIHGVTANEAAETVPYNHRSEADVTSDDDLEWLWRRLSDDN